MAGSIVSMGRVGGVRGPLHINLPPAPDPSFSKHGHS